MIIEVKATFTNGETEAVRRNKTFTNAEIGEALHFLSSAAPAGGAYNKTWWNVEILSDSGIVYELTGCRIDIVRNQQESVLSHVRDYCASVFDDSGPFGAWIRNKTEAEDLDELREMNNELQATERDLSWGACPMW